MLSRGRSCLKRRNLPTIIDNGAEEPLFFLYPRWATSAVHQRRLISSVRYTASSLAGRGERLYCASAARGQLIERSGPISREWRRWVSVESGSGGEKVEIKEEIDNGQTQTLQEENGKGQNQEISSLGEKKELKEEGAQRDIAQEANGDEQSQQDTTIHREIYEGAPAPTDEQRERQRHVFNVFSDLPTRPLQLSTGRKGMRSVAAVSGESSAIALRRLSHRDRLKLKYRVFLAKYQSCHRLDDRWNKWIKIRDLLEDMYKNTQVWEKTEVKQKEMLLPEETVAILAGVTDMALKENIWYVPVHNGCKVHVLHPRQSQGRFRKVILSGSERVIAMVSDNIAEARALQERNDPLVDIRIPVVPVIPSVEAMKRQNIPVPLIRGVWDIQTAVKNPAQLHLILPAGETLSCVRDFAEHVEELTRSKKSYNSKIPCPHKLQVARALVQLFRNRSYSSFISTAALNRAMSYLLDQELLRSARAIFLRSEHLATVDTFNILLKSSAKRQDLVFFHHILLTMSRLNIRPDSRTWLALLGCLVSTKAKTDLVDYIVRRGYLDDTGAMRSALHLTLPNTFRAHLESGQSVDSFIRKTAETCGASCFAPSLVTQMFDVTVRLRDFAAMDRLFQICKYQDLTFSSATVAQIMSLFRADVPTALGYLFRCLERPETKLDRYTWERLFLVAFRGEYYNVCRVLWRYACMTGNVTYKMKRAVVTSLIRNVPRKPEVNVHTIWDVSAGKVIVGLDLHCPDSKFQAKVLENLPAEYRTNPVAYLCSGFGSAGEEREQQIRLASALAEHDIQVGAWHRPQLPLMIMLEAALVLDLEWRNVPRPVHWLVQNAIRVQVRKSLIPH